MKRNCIRFSSYFFLLFISFPVFALKNKGVTTLYLKDYIVHLKKSQGLAVDKHNFETHSFEIPVQSKNLNLYCRENTLFYIGKDFKKSICIKSVIDYQEKTVWVVVSSSLFIVILLVIYFFYRKQTKTDHAAPSIVEKHSYYERIILHEGKSLRTHEIDELFDIQKLSYDSRKLKRHRLIQEINKKHPQLIQRVKDKEDQRKYLYFINKN